MPELAPAPLRVAILSGSSRQRDRLSEILEDSGMQVIADAEFNEKFPDRISGELVDVFLVDLDYSDSLDQHVLDMVLEQTDVPVLFNEGATTRVSATPSGRAWGRRLAGKLMKLAQGVEYDVTDGEGERIGVTSPELRLVEAASTQADEGMAEDFDDAVRTELEEIHGALGTLAETRGDEMFVDLAIAESTEPTTVDIAPDEELDGSEARSVWVLAASIGGPQAVKEFIRALPADLPIGLVMAQHIGAGFVSLLAEQLARVTDLQVSCAEEGMRVKKGQLVVAPVEKRIVFGDRGRVELQPVVQRSVYSPCIDAVMYDVVSYFGGNTGAIVFSGMGSDGLKGCRAISEQGGIVWAQDEASCVISSMADSVRAAGLVSHSASPTGLAEALMKHLERSAA